MITTALSRAIELAKQGYAVFPVGKSKRPLTPHGHLDGTTDVEAVATMFGEFPDAFVGIHVERSGIVVLDIDTHSDDKNGFESLELAWLGVDESFAYPTPSGGRHVWYHAPQALNLPPQVDYRGMSGVDRKSGSSYVVFYASEVPDHIELAPAPEWLCDARESRAVGDAFGGDAFEGDLDEWLADLDAEQPGDRVLGAIMRIPDEDFGHPQMVERQFELIRLAAEGAPGVRHALDALREAWLRAPYDTEDNAYEFDSALYSGVKKFGASLARIDALPTYIETLDLIGSTATDRLMGEPKSKRQYFQIIETLAKYNITDHQIATLMWHGPAVRPLAREWGIDYLYSAIADARLKALAPVENPALGLDSIGSSTLDLPLLSDEERVVTAAQYCLVDAYLAWARGKVNVLNEPYHRQNALTVMSLVLGGHIFIPLKSRRMGVNLFQLGLGESSTGKSESINLRDQILKTYFSDDLEYNVGSNPSPEALQDVLLARDHKVSFFNTDEAAAPLNEFMVKSYTAGMVDRLTSYYEGFVPPMLRRGGQGQGQAPRNSSAITSFNISLFGTPDKVIDLLTREMFESGFLARFCWTISAPVSETDEQYEEQQALEKQAVVDDPVAGGFAEALAVAQGVRGIRQPVLATRDALIRLGENRKLMDKSLKEHDQYTILQPSVRRLGDNIRKIATMLAVADGSHMVHERHALKAIELGEELFHNVQRVATRVSASLWERSCDAIENYVVEQGGECAASRVFHRFRKFELRDVLAQVESLVQQGRLIRFEATKDRGDWLQINTGEKEY